MSALTHLYAPPKPVVREGRRVYLGGKPDQRLSSVERRKEEIFRYLKSCHVPQSATEIAAIFGIQNATYCRRLLGGLVSEGLVREIEAGRYPSYVVV